MKKNIGKTDKLIRLSIALVLGLLVFFDILPHPYQWVALGGAAMLAITSITSFCGLYAIFGKSTCEIQSKD
jgi:hypothetical protein